MTSQAERHRGIADQVVDLARRIGIDMPVRVRAWDESESGPEGGPLLVLRDRTALRRVLRHPGELSLAQAYILGEIDVEGDLSEALGLVWRQVRAAKRNGVRPGPVPLLRAALLAARAGGIGPLPPATVAHARLSGALHSRERDSAAVAHHYDLSNDFYRLILDPDMAYSCGYWKSDESGSTLAEAQQEKLELICGKLGLKPGMRLLDIGCGWGSLSLHAGRHHGVRATAATLSAQQCLYVSQRITTLGLDGLVEVQCLDYRDLDDGPYDAVAAIEMGEHVGQAMYPSFAARIRGLLAPGGRLLVQQMSRRSGSPGGGPFVESYIAPDMHMRPVGETVGLLEQAGLEVRDVHAMREHYVPTIDAWLANLEQRWTDITDLVGEPTARIWRLYLTGASLAFAERRMGVDQILAIRPTADGMSGMPAIRRRQAGR